MLNLNRATIIGHLTRDPEMRSTATGQSVANFSVATNRRWTSREGEQQEETEFHDVVAWGKLAEIAVQIFKKGNLSYIEGRLQTRSWEAQDGNKRQRTEIVADNLINLQPRSVSGTGSTSTPAGLEQKPADKKSQDVKALPKSKKVEQEEEEIDIDDIPL